MKIPVTIAIGIKFVSHYFESAGIQSHNLPHQSHTCSHLLSLVFYVLATSKVISGYVLICDSAHTWQLYSAVPLVNEGQVTMA